MLSKNLLSASVKSVPITPGVPYVWGDNYQYGLGVGVKSDFGGAQVYASNTQFSIWGVATGSYNSAPSSQTAFIVKQDGTLWGWGANSYGELGIGTVSGTAGSYYGTNTLTKLNSNSNWALAACNVNATVATKTDGTLWTWGYNSNGQLGSGTVVSRSSPVQVGALTNWPTSDFRKLCGAQNANFAIKSDGTLWAFGSNTFGALGDGTSISRSSPVQIGAGTTWKHIASFGNGAIATKTDGTLWAWGFNGNGQLGQNNLTNYSSPVQIGAATTWSTVGANVNDCFAIKTDGTLWAWGKNANGELGLGDAVARSSPVQVGADTNWSSVYVGNTWSSYATTIFVKTTGAAYVTGYTRNYVSPDALRSSPVQIGSLTNVSGALFTQINYLYGKGDVTANSALLTLTNTSANVGSTSGGGGVPGIYNYTYAPVPILFETTTQWNNISMNYYSSAAVKSNGTLWTWGTGGDGQLGKNSTSVYLSPTQTGSGTTWKSVSSASYSMAAVKTDGTLWTWGRNTSGQLAQNNVTSYSSPVQVGAGTSWSSVSAAASGTSLAGSVCAIKTDGTLWSWGNNNYGQLGDGTVVVKSSPVQIGSDTNWKQVSCGLDCAAAIKSNGTLWVWGRNTNGQLGQNNTANKSSPVQIAGTTWSSVCASYLAMIALKSDGTLWSWGLGGSGQLGNNTVISSSSPVQIGSGTTWASIGGTVYGFFATKTDGTMWGWGDGLSNGDGTGLNRSSPVQLSSNATGGTTKWISPSTTVSNFGQAAGALKT